MAVDDVVAAMLGVPAALLRSPGLHAAPALPGYRGIYVWSHDDTTIVCADGTLGPSRHHYLERGDAFAPDPEVRPVTAIDDVAALRAAVGDDDWHEGGFGDELADDDRWWVLGDGLAAGNMTDVPGVGPTDVGLVTHPDARGRGLAERVARHMLWWAFTEQGHELARYRALTTNTASLRVAEKLGFSSFGTNVAVRLPT